MGRNGYGPILTLADFVMGRNDPEPEASRTVERYVPDEKVLRYMFRNAFDTAIGRLVLYTKTDDVLRNRFNGAQCQTEETCSYLILPIEYTID